MLSIHANSGLEKALVGDNYGSMWLDFINQFYLDFPQFGV
jgi:hypothetical protein